MPVADGQMDRRTIEYNFIEALSALPGSKNIGTNANLYLNMKKSLDKIHA